MAQQRRRTTGWLPVVGEVALEVGTPTARLAWRGHFAGQDELACHLHTGRRGNEGRLNVSASRTQRSSRLPASICDGLRVRESEGAVMPAGELFSGDAF